MCVAQTDVGARLTPYLGQGDHVEASVDYRLVDGSRLVRQRPYVEPADANPTVIVLRYMFT